MTRRVLVITAVAALTLIQAVPTAQADPTARQFRVYATREGLVGGTTANGHVIRDGSDLPRLGRAEKIMKLAVAFGVQPAL